MVTQAVCGNKLRMPNEKRKDDMTKHKQVGLNHKTIEAFEELRKAFRKKFGRDPGPTDPVFFDSTASEPRPMTANQQREIVDRIVKEMKSVGIKPAIIYAFRKTGLLLTEKNVDRDFGRLHKS